MRVKTLVVAQSYNNNGTATILGECVVLGSPGVPDLASAGRSKVTDQNKKIKWIKQMSKILLECYLTRYTDFEKERYQFGKK